MNYLFTRIRVSIKKALHCLLASYGLGNYFLYIFRGNLYIADLFGVNNNDRTSFA